VAAGHLNLPHVSENRKRKKELPTKTDIARKIRSRSKFVRAWSQSWWRKSLRWEEFFSR